MSKMETNVLSEGEISNDSDENERYSIISSGEDEYFKNLTNEIKTRQAELELENVLLRGYADDYAKENCFKKNKQPKRSFRASCVYSYSLPKRKRSYRATKKKGKHSRSSNKKFTDKKGVENEEKQKKEEEECGGGGGEDYDDDCELIALRLSALRSKQELKEFSPKPEQNQQIEEIEHEEELLRIDALRSALLKKKDHFMEKKLTRKLEKEKPYSPTDDLDKILDDDAVELTPPRMQSPQDDINQMDMEISNSPILHEQTFVNQEENDNEEEERVLRSMLLSSISNKRKAEEKNVAINLKLAVERLRQAQQRQQVSVFSPPPKVPVRLQATKKSGTKTIKMLLEEKKIRKIENVSEYHAQIEAENVLLNKITNEQNEKIESLPTPLVEDIMAAAENNILLPTISDTKNIPLLSKDTDYNIRGTKKSRVLTSLVKHNVKPLIINVNAESSDDDVGDPSQHENNDGSKNTHRKIIRVNDSKVTMKTIVDPQHQQHIDIIEKQVENLLRKIRLQSENQPSKSIVRNTAVNHLPRSSQIEYAMLMEKMRILEETKIIRRQLKRQKSSSNDAIKNDTNQAENLKKKFATEKVEDTLSKVQLLNETARERFAFNAENKYLDHSNSLKSTTEDLIKLVRANSLNILRRQKVDVKIAELEKQLAKFRSMKKVLEHRINTGIPQIIRSQMTLIKLRNHQHNFGNMCLRVGKIIRGPGYSLPDDGNINEIQTNLLNIVKKCDEIQIACSDHFAIKHLNHNLQKIREFLTNTENIEDNNVILCDEKKCHQDDISADYSLSGRKRNLDLDAASPSYYNSLISKKIKYESPLEYGSRSEKSEKEVICPNALINSCQDSNCQMLHI